MVLTTVVALGDGTESVAKPAFSLETEALQDRREIPSRYAGSWERKERCVDDC